LAEKHPNQTGTLAKTLQDLLKKAKKMGGVYTKRHWKKKKNQTQRHYLFQSTGFQQKEDWERKKTQPGGYSGETHRKIRCPKKTEKVYTNIFTGWTRNHRP